MTSIIKYNLIKWNVSYNVLFINLILTYVSFNKVFSALQTIMTVRSGGSVTTCVKTVQELTTAAALMDTF